MTAGPRFAVYYAPAPEHPLWRAGCDWLGRDAAASGATTAARVGVDEPRRYGFHATLKAPMRLVDGQHEEHLRAALQALAAGFTRFAMPELVVSTIADFVALRPRGALDRMHPLRRLADACVIDLDRFRAPPDSDEQRRRDPAALNDEQRALLGRYGYPHVLDRWRFHMTLTDRLPAGALSESGWLHCARGHFASALAEPLGCEAISLFVEPAPGLPFVLQERFPLRTPDQSPASA